MSSKRDTLHLYDDLDPTKALSIEHSSGVITFTVPDTMTVSGKSTFVGTTTCVRRAAGDGSLSDHTLESLFDQLDTDTAANSAAHAAEATRATAAEASLSSSWATSAAAAAATDVANHATAMGAITTETTRAQLQEAALQANLSTEQARAEVAEASLTADVSALGVTHATHLSAHMAAISAESARATAAENAIQSDEDANEAAAAAARSALQTSLQANIDANSASLATQSAAAQAAETGLNSQLQAILSNSDATPLNSLQEIQQYFNGTDETNMNLLGLLMNKVLQVNQVIDTFLDPDMPALDNVLQAHFDANLCLSSLSGSGASGSSISSNLGDGSPHTGSTHSMSYFLDTPFTLAYDLTQRVTYDGSGAATVRGMDYVTEDLFIAGLIATNAAPDYASAKAAWDGLLAAGGGAGNEAAVYTATVGMSPENGLRAAVNAVYGFIPADVAAVPLPYNDPEHYMLEVGKYGDRPLFKGAEVDSEPFVGWRLTYCSVAGDASTAFSSILSGTQTSNTLTISAMNDGSGTSRAVEFPVSGNPSTGSREGTFIVDMLQITSA